MAVMISSSMRTLTPAAYGVKLMAMVAGDIWRILPAPQQAALAEALPACRNELGEELRVRIRVKVHARVAAALRTAGLVRSLEAEHGRRDLTTAGIMVRDFGLWAGSYKVKP